MCISISEILDTLVLQGVNPEMVALGSRTLRVQACSGKDTAGSQPPHLLWHEIPSSSAAGHGALDEICPGTGYESPVPTGGEDYSAGKSCLLYNPSAQRKNAKLNSPLTSSDQFHVGTTIQAFFLFFIFLTSLAWFPQSSPSIQSTSFNEKCAPPILLIPQSYLLRIFHSCLPSTKVNWGPCTISWLIINKVLAWPGNALEVQRKLLWRTKEYIFMKARLMKWI